MPPSSGVSPAATGSHPRAWSRPGGGSWGKMWTAPAKGASVHERLAAPVPLGGDVFVVDTQMSGYAGITSAYVLRTERPCLVETGTATSAATVVDALGELGIGPDDLATIVVTHVHLDHAGGVGDLAEAFPRAGVVVHEAGARHLAEPDRLLASARRVFGSV